MAMNPEDKITVDVPLFIRLLEYAREDAKTDMDLHDVAENAVSLSADGKTLTMNDYSALVTVSKEPMNEDDWKQSDDESDMAHSQLISIKSNTEELMNMINKDEQLDAWVQSKLTKAQDYLESIKDYLKGEETIDESSTGDPSLQRIAGEIFNKLPKEGSYELAELFDDLVTSYNLSDNEKKEVYALVKDIENQELGLSEISQKDKKALAYAIATNIAKYGQGKTPKGAKHVHLTKGLEKKREQAIMPIKKVLGVKESVINNVISKLRTK